MQKKRKVCELVNEDWHFISNLWESNKDLIRILGIAFSNYML